MLRRAAALAALYLATLTAQADVITTQDIEYARVADEVLRFDLYRPEGKVDAPLLVYVHGGAWEAGSKEPMPLTALVERGYAIASIDFRPASRARFPGQIHDIKAAVRYLRATAGEHGYDASRIGIIGTSSGAHLAALVGVTNGDRELEGTLGAHLDTSSGVQSIVWYFGASNLTTILTQSTPFGLRIREPSLQRLLGALPAENEAIARRASPVFYVGSNDPPLLLLHGDQDPQMPINQSHELHGAYKKAGHDTQLIVVHGAAHGGDAFYSEENIEAVARFLDRTLRK